MNPPPARPTVGLEPRRWVGVALAGGAILFVSIGARQGFGLFLLPLTADLGLGREAFATAIAVQYLVWGLAGPLAGVLADRFTPARTLIAGGMLYTAGYLLASRVESARGFLGAAGVLVGLGLGGASFGVVHGAVARAVPARRRGAALGLVGAATALGQFLLLFYSQLGIEHLGWRGAFVAHALLVALIVPLAWALREAGVAAGAAAPDAADGMDLAQALRAPAFWLLCAGFGFSGWQVMFTMTHLPALVADLGLAPADAVRALAVVSFSSFVGSWLFGRWADRVDARWLLAGVYAARAAMAWLALIVPFTPARLVVYFGALGLVWMCTIPLASSLTARLFGTRRMASIFGTVFLAHQLGGFAGTWLGGVVFDRVGSYAPMWWVIAALGGLGSVLAGLIKAPARA